MTQAAQSIRLFGLYTIVLGLGLLIAPNLLLGLFDIPASPEVWIRVVGLLAMNIGVYYWFAANTGSRALFTMTIYTRTLVLLAFIAFAALGLVSPVIILFGLADAAGAAWTWFTLRTR
jgi:hypothetical protein